MLGLPGHEISIPSTLKHETTSYVVITEETERFVDEIHDHKDEIRSSTELLSAFQKSDGREPCVEEEESNSIKETCAHPFTSRYGNKEACANNLSNLPSDSLFKKTIILTNERMWIVIDANPSHGGALLTQVSKMVTKVITIKTNENKMDHIIGTP